MIHICASLDEGIQHNHRFIVDGIVKCSTSVLSKAISVSKSGEMELSSIYFTAISAMVMCLTMTGCHVPGRAG